jgi:hypothetical protein
MQLRRHNRKREVLVVPIATVKSTKPIVETKTQPPKPIRVHILYPYIICSNVKHRSRECPKKIEMQNTFRTKLVNSNVATRPKPPKLDNVLVNAVTTITTHGQQLEQQVSKERKPVEAKRAEDWQ